MEEQQGRMMLYPQQNYGMGGMGGEESLATSPAPTQGDESQQQRQHADINTILDQVHSFDLDTIVGKKTSDFENMMDLDILPISFASDYGGDRPVLGRGPKAHTELPQNETSSFLCALRDQREDSDQHKKLQRRRPP